MTITPTNNELTEKCRVSTSTTIYTYHYPVSVTFEQLIAVPSSYNGQFVIVDGFYFSGFEISH